MKPRILFAIPTLFYNKKLVMNCVSTLKQNLDKFNIDYEICVVINTMTPEFEVAEFGANVTKLSSNLQFNIGKALNTAAYSKNEYDYFCYIDDGMTITNDFWIDYLIELFQSNSNIGLVGCRPHSTFNNYHKKINDVPELYEVLWSDGILFTTKQIFDEVQGIDEIYFGDCELQDFGYKLHFAGYVNLYWAGLGSHKLIDYTVKSDKPEMLIKLANKSRELFKQKWNDIEFKTYNFKSNPA